MLTLRDEILRHALTSRFMHFQTGHRVYLPGRVSPPETSPLNRMHLILSGQMEYVIGGQPCALQEGDQSLSLAWSRRRWSVAGDAPCEIVFVAFGTVEPVDPPTGLFARHLDTDDFATERGMFRRLHLRHNDYIETQDELWAEGEIKGSLARFLRGPFFFSPDRASAGALSVHPQVRRAQELLMLHFAAPDALERMRQEIRVTPNYLRRLFQSDTGQTPGEFLLRVRMQRARHLLQKTTLAVKEVAASVGFNDALHFSRRYAGFWKNAPSADRKTRASG